MVDCVAIVMEYAKNGELFEYVRRKQKVPENITKNFMFQIFLAVDNMHANGIVHRDLKLENILLDEGNQIKIADFGFANYWNDQINDNGKLVQSLLKTSCGSPCYAAPEIVLNNKVKNSDIFCFLTQNNRVIMGLKLIFGVVV
jgi:serine/threonine protein kinase